MPTYTLQMHIDPTQVRWLAENGFKLCIARETNGQCTVIWQTQQAGNSLMFSWDEEFQTFWTEQFAAGRLVTEGCRPEPIAYGQTVVIDRDSSMSTATGNADGSGKFTTINKFSQPVHVGLKSKINGSWRTSYVSPFEVITESTMVLTPLSSVKVWFEANAEAGSMITEIRGNSYSVDFQSTMSRTIRYMGGQWANESPA